MIEKECHVTTPKFECHDLGGQVLSGKRRTKQFWNLYPKPKSVFELKVALDYMGHFSAGPVDKTVPIFRLVWHSTWGVTEDIMNIFL